jgi:hypothetical protein
MPAPDSTLQAIQTKVRRLTRRPSEAQLSDADLQNYINTFVVYDFPEHLRMFNLRTTFRFWTNPGQDVYLTGNLLNNDGYGAGQPLTDFQQNYISVHDPVYIAGYQALFSQSREQFFGIYPNVANIMSIGPQGDGVTTTFTGNVITSAGVNANNTSPGAIVLQNKVLFSSVDINGNGLALVDVPVINAINVPPLEGTGYPTQNGNLYVPGNQAVNPIVVTPTNTINYATGVYTITFATPPAAGASIDSQIVLQQPTLPQALLYYDNKFIVRPVPDQPYEVNMEAYVRPTWLMSTNQSPLLQEWWQFIAIGAARKILQDVMDMDTVALLEPEFKKQEALCLRRTIVQYTNERTATIYTDQVGVGGGTGQWGWGGGPF